MIEHETIFGLQLPLAPDQCADLPFAFKFGGHPSTELLQKWDRTVVPVESAGNKNRQDIIYSDPKTGLGLRYEVIRYTDFPAVELVLYFYNDGEEDTPIIENIRPLDLRLAVPPGEVMLYHSHGSTCTATDFLPKDAPVTPHTLIELTPNGGRSSDGNLPFMNLAWQGGGVMLAIGWSGQWALKLERDGEGQITLQAGQQTTHLTLHPGECIRTPRILLIGWEGDDRLLGHNLLRQVLLAHYVPRRNDEVAVPPVTQNTWFTFNEGNEVTEANQLAIMPSMVRAGVEAYWLDAGWFEGGWPNGAGSWVPKPEAFPRGLQPIGKAAHQLGLQFVLWFEPERVTPNSRVAREHPEWVMHSADDNEWGRLFNLGDPAAREWLTDYLSQCINEWGIDIYRNDFNIDPLRFWQAADAPDRQGMAEICYIEGLYAMWDELRRRHPGMLIDDCASGGRRIDLEMISRSFPLWQSDTQCGGKPMPVWDQMQNAGLSLYVPLHAAGVWGFDHYTFRSVATTGYSICPDLRGDEQLLAQARRMTDEAKSLRPYYLGDYYPLLPITLDETHWAGWQYHRPDLGAGFVMLFRRPLSPYPRIEVRLHGLDAGARYMVTDVDAGITRTLTGAELTERCELKIATAPGSVLLRYTLAI